MKSNNADRIVVFDWDGTLINSLDIKVHNAGLLFHLYLGWQAERVEKIYRKHSGIPRRVLFEAICAEHGLIDLAEQRYLTLSQRFTRMNREAILNTPASELLFPDTVSTLHNLVELAYPLYVSSSADPQEICSIAENLGIDRYFKRSGGNLFGSKPGFNKGDQHIQYILQQHQVDLSDFSEEQQRRKVAFVGDEPADIRLGRQAGVVTIAKTGTYTEDRLKEEAPDYIIQSLGVLPTLLGSIQRV